MKRISMVLVLIVFALPFIGITNSTAQEETTGQGIFESRFNEIDTNKDGKISRNEHKEYMEKRAENNFATTDTNKDGFISEEEAKMAMNERMEKRKERARKLLEEKKQ